MGVASSSLLQGNVGINGATTATVYNVSAAIANTEYSQALSNGTKQYSIRVRGMAKLQYTFTVGESGTKFLTVPQGCTHSVDMLTLTGKTIYFQVDKNTQVVEILEWK